MATDTKIVKAQKARSAGTLFESIEQSAAASRVPQLAELLTKVADKIGLENIAETIANAIQEGTPAMRQKNALEYANLIRQFQQMVGEPTKDEITQMATPVIYTMLEKEFRLIHESNDKDHSEGTEEAAEGVDSGTESV